MPFDHILFARRWKLSPETTNQLGQCDALVKTLSMVPLRPEVHQKLKQVSLIKGAQASTAIEGNTLSEDEVRQVMHGEQLGASRAYQQQEVSNIIQAMNDVLTQSKPELITPQLLLRYHRMVGKDLPAPFNATAGQFAQSQRVVGGSRCPPPGRGRNQTEGLVQRLCEWLPTEFHFRSGKQSFTDGVIQAIVTHLYIEWIHPFDDGNGRTGRLVEFYLLLRAGVPDICAHILSNYYNNTRPQYYAHIQQCQQSKQLTPFIAYAVSGFLDGLREVWDTVAYELLEKTWQTYITDRCAELKWNAPTLKRRRQLMLELPLNQSFTEQSIQIATPNIAKIYATVSPTTIKRDLTALVAAKLLSQDPNTNQLTPNTKLLTAHYPQGLQS